MQFNAKEIALLIQGEVIGDECKTISKFSKIEEADIDSLCFYAHENYASYLKETKAGILLVNNQFSLSTPKQTTLIKVEDPYKATAILLEFYQKTNETIGIEPYTVVSDSAQLGKNIYIASFAYISDNVQLGNNVKVFPHVFIGKNVSIGDNTILYSGAKIYDDTIIGNNCKIHSGAVIGGDGFGYAPTENGDFKKIPQVGNVILEDNVEIGCNTTIDRATMGSTLIKQGAKLDNLIQIAHNVVIGKNTAIAALAGVAGSAKIGDNVMIGGLTGIKGHITIGNRTKINASSGVWSSVGEDEFLTGNPAFDFKKMMRVFILIKKLPELFERISNLEKKK